MADKADANGGEGHSAIFGLGIWRSSTLAQKRRMADMKVISRLQRSGATGDFSWACARRLAPAQAVI